ncbi:MAG TPA: plasmid mobilization relaxosome protein MobC [Streptosporangiaceae bacterium]|nr:plasmid mobilization relaxosome protein MobC [Streptosporangiaceae bacterium]
MDEKTTRKPAPSAAQGATRLRRVVGGREHAIKVKLNNAEYQAISTRAADRKLSMQRFLLSCALAPRTEIQPVRAPSTLTAELAGLRRLTANLANNINQIARVLNSGGVPDTSIPATADAVRRAMTRLDSVLSGMTPDHTASPAARSTPSPKARPIDRGSSHPVPEAP